MPENTQHYGITTLDGPTRFEAEIKKSRFIATATRVISPDGALATLKLLASPDATHNCWAYRIGNEYRFSDDGEPGGSAGRPILAAIESQGLDQVLVVVIRYFGGIKLGVGGLVRAYGGTAAECLRTAPRLVVKPLTRVRVEIPFPDTSNVYNLLSGSRVERISETYVTAGIILELELETADWESFRNRLNDATKGKMRVVELRKIV